MFSLRQRRHVSASPVFAVALALFTTFGILPGFVRAEPVQRPVKVMTRNIYLGADLLPAVQASTPLELALAGTQIWNTVLATGFPERAELLAREIAEADPALIGLQEVALWRIGPPDGPPILGGTEATLVAFDFLGLLQVELEERGAPYVVVISQQEADIESVTVSGFDIRLTQRDVILARKCSVDAGEISWMNVQGAHYPPAIQLSLPLLGGLVSIESTRGYISADCTVNKRTFRFVNTHLEAFSAGRRAQQAAFLAQYGPASTLLLPVVLVGDLNSDPLDDSVDPPDPTPNSLAFNVLTGIFGFVDTWTQANGTLPGFTYGFGEFVNDPNTSGFNRRYDHVLTRPTVTVRKSKVTGLDSDNRSPSGLWPSDHAGVIATLAP